MENSIVRSMRLPQDVTDGVNEQADKLGITFNESIIYCLRSHLGLPQDPSIPLLEAISRWVADTYSPKDFPEDVTLHTFRHLRDTPALRKQYDRLLQNDTGTIDKKTQGQLHRRIGALVRNVLDAHVVGRSLEYDPEVELIKTHALLRPKA